MAKSRVHDLFGHTSNSLLFTLTIDYRAKHPQSSAPSSKWSRIRC